MNAAPALSPEQQAEMRQRIAEMQAATPLAEQMPARAFRFLNLAEMLTEPQPPEWLILGYLEAYTLAVLFGAPGSMKSFLALDMLLCIASGLPWHGAKVPKPGAVFYIAGEGFRGVVKRIQAWVVAHGVNIEDVPLFTADTPVQFLDHAEAEAVTVAVADLAEKHGAPRLLVVDTLARCFGGDENSTQDMSAFVSALDRLRNRFGCAVLVIHHTGHGEKDRARGSSVLNGALDFEYSLKAVGDTRTLTCTKAKDHEKPPALCFEPEPIATGWTDKETGQAIVSCVLRKVDGVQGKVASLPGTQLIAYETLQELAKDADGGRVHIKAWREATYSRGISLSEDIESKAKAFKRAAGKLIAAKRVQMHEDYYWPDTGHTGQTGQMPDMSWPYENGQTGHTPLGVSVLSGTVDSGEVVN